MDVLDDLVLDEWKDGGQFAQLSLGVHLPQSGSDEVVVKAVERQVVATIRVRSVRMTRQWRTQDFSMGEVEALRRRGGDVWGGVSRSTENV